MNIKPALTENQTNFVFIFRSQAKNNYRTTVYIRKPNKIETLDSCCCSICRLHEQNDLQNTSTQCPRPMTQSTFQRQAYRMQCRTVL